MERVRLQGTALEVSRLCFGNMTFGGQTDEAAGRRMIDYCLSEGINFLDTANIYQKGVSEEMLGRMLAGRRAQVVLASKVRGVMGPGPDESGLTAPAIRKAIEGSLSRLRTDYLDLYYLHLPDNAVPLEETLDAMDRLVREGKIRYMAISNYPAWQVVEMHWIAQRRGHAPVRVAQMMYNVMTRGLEQEFVPFAREHGVSIVAYNPLAGGLLTGKQRREAPLEGTRFDKNQMYLDRYWYPELFDAVEELRGVARECGRTLISLALNWLLHHTPTAVVILGASRQEQLEENVAAAREGPLPQAALEGCDRVWRKLRGVTPTYNR